MMGGVWRTRQVVRDGVAYRAVEMEVWMDTTR
jgi:hypothetical protein